MPPPRTPTAGECLPDADELEALLSETLVRVERKGRTHLRLLLAGDEGLAESVGSSTAWDGLGSPFVAFTTKLLPPTAGVHIVSVTVDVIVLARWAGELAALADRAERHVRHDR